MSKLPIAALALAITAGTAQAAPVQWEENGHWYEVITQNNTWLGARNNAATKSHLGLTGYLATITSAAELAFVTASFNPSLAWLGGSDEAEEGTWRWVTGPEAGTVFTYTNWVPNEPNDLFGDEDYLIGWWFSPQWNDLSATQTNLYSVVEYSGAAPAPVPLPAAMGLLLVGLGALGATRMSRRG